MKSPFIGFLMLADLSSAASVMSGVWDVSGQVPDNSVTGWSDTRHFSSISVVISEVEVFLETTGGFNGDLYAYLAHDSGFSVLLNRVGRSESNPDGSFTTGMSVVFSDAAGQDVHTAETFDGIYQPDGRQGSPFTVTESTARTARLSSFDGLDPDGSWTLFVADLSPGYQTTVVRWGITLTTAEVVPEPSPLLAAGVMALVVMSRRKRRTDGGV